LKGVKAFGIVITVLQLLGFVLFALSFHTLYSVMSSAMSGDAFTFAATMDEATGELAIRLEGGLRNDGFLGADLTVEAAVLDVSGEYIDENSTTTRLEAGSQRSLILTLTVPPAETQQGGLEKGFLFEIAFRLRTLEDLVGFSNTIRIRGGGEG